ncbi:E3 UFM1-protein ligase 1 homolog isoform X2 [Eupeodes corollae]|uniref:E3 UFM1-protein ligase 1 homolog isoform X2 n=1 Tax=Eupeodes corollae TaxID=290404 RepID=UPI00249111E1|nr:E3 UFM1-protein ligase 1 homolog isoform X2 [Eupeodes corollae]
MSNDWNEIKRLAADFHKAQFTSGLQKLSESNCVEVVSFLLRKNFVSVVFTNDGKEYVTPEHLEKQVLDEVYMNGGRVNMVQLSKSLNVDLTKIDYIASKITSENKIRVMLGQLIEENYLMQIAQEINEKLIQKGEINISNLTVQYDLPSDFLQSLMEKYLGKIIRCRQDTSNPRIFFTQAYIKQCKSIIRGLLAAVTKPTTFVSIRQQAKVPENIILSLIDEISPAGSLTSKLSNADYVPHIYNKMQSDWITSFYKQNGFLEYDIVSKLGISDCKNFIKKSFPDEEMLYLTKSVVGSKIIDLTFIAALNECHLTKGYVDLSSILPSNMSTENIQELFQTIINLRNIPDNFVCLDNIVFSNQFIEAILKPCHDLAIEKAKEAIKTGMYQKELSSKKNYIQGSSTNSKVEKREERRKKFTCGKSSSGAGNNGTETKSKAAKKNKRCDKYKIGCADSDSDLDNHTNKKSNKVMELIKKEEIEKIIWKFLKEEDLEHLSGVMSDIYHNEINQRAIREAHTLFETTAQTNTRQIHASVQDKINTLVVDIRLYGQGLKVFPIDVQSQMLKYLMKTLGNDICTELTIYIANECNLNINSGITLNIDQRNKIANECEPEYKTKLIEVNKALSKTFEEFVLATEEVLIACGMVIKKVDKKRDRILIIQHKEKLFKQLYETDDNAATLHLTSLIIFTSITGLILHASGRFVPQILAFIRPSMSSEQNILLLRFHDLVLKVLQLNTECEEYKTVNSELNSMQMEIKSLAESYEKPGVTKVY